MKTELELLKETLKGYNIDELFYLDIEKIVKEIVEYTPEYHCIKLYDIDDYKELEKLMEYKDTTYTLMDAVIYADDTYKYVYLDTSLGRLVPATLIQVYKEYVKYIDEAISEYNEIEELLNR